MVNIVSGQNTNAITVSRNNLSSGRVTISAAISFSVPACKSTKTVSLSAWVGSPVAPSSIRPKARTIMLCELGSLSSVFPPNGVSSVNATFTDFIGGASVNITLPVSPRGWIAFPDYGLYLFTSVSNNCGTFTYPNFVKIRVIEYCLEDLVRKKSENLSKEPIVNIFPNPSGGQVTIENILVGSKVSIYDNLGRMMFTSASSEGNSIKIDIASLKTGIYILEAVLPNNQKTRKNIVRE